MTDRAGQPKAESGAGAAPPAAPDALLDRLQTGNLRAIAGIAGAALTLFAAVSLAMGLFAGAWQYYSIAAVSAGFACCALVAIALLRLGRRTLAAAVFFSAAFACFLLSSLLVNDRNLLFSGRILIVVNLLGVILTVPPRHLGRACILCLAGGLLLAGFELGRPPADQFNDSALLLFFAGTLAALAAVMAAILAYQYAMYPLATKLIAVLLLIALAPTLAQGYFDSRILQRELAGGASARLYGAAADTANDIDNHIEERARFSRIAARFPAFLEGVHPDAFPPESRQGVDHIRDILAIVAGENSLHDHVFSLVDLEGRRLISTRPAYEGTTAVLPGGALATPPSDEIVTPLRFEEAGPPQGEVEIFTPIRDGAGAVRGYLVVGVDGAVFQRIARRRDGAAGPMSYALVVDEAGVRMADASSDAHVFTPTAPLDPATAARWRDERRIRPGGIPEPFAPPGLAQALAVYAPDDRNAFARPSPETGAVLGAHAPMRTLPWRAAFVQPQFALYAPLNRESTVHIFATMTIGLVAVAVAIAVAHGLSRPIVRLADAAELIRQGDLDVRIPPGGHDETGRLAAAFGAMAQRIRESMNGLEERIVELRESNAARQRSEDALKKLFDNAPIGMIIVDRKSRVVSINRAAGELLGYEADELIGRDSRLFAHPDDRETGIDAGRTLLRDGQDAIHFEKRYVRKNGDLVHTLVALTRVADSDGNLFVAQMIDLTERTRAARRLAESEARYRLISENSSDIIALQSPDGVVRWVSPAAERILGWTAGEIVGHSFFDFVHPDDASDAAGAPFRRLPKSDDGAFVFRARHRDGGYRWLESKARVVADPDGGEVKEVVTVSRDISDRLDAERERQELETQMQHSQKLESLGVLAGGIAHDFNNLLVGMMGHAGLALMEPDDREGVREHLENIEKAAQRASELTKQLLAYSGKGRFVIEPLDLGRIVREMAYLLEVSTAKNAAMRFALAENLPAIEGDPSQIGQVVMNLITNASDAIGDRQGRIDVRTGEETLDEEALSAMRFSGAEGPGRFVWLDVTDDGHGMTPETADRIFDPFFTTKFTGRGLGLAAVIGIVRSHRGAIRFRSAPEQGASFRVYFPASDKAAPAPQDEGPDAPPARTPQRRTVLVVDDEPMVRDTARRTLERAGYDVVLAVDGLDGVETYRRCNGAIDAVLLDLTMPRMDGEQCLRALRAENPAVRVIISSGFDEQDTARRFGGAPPDGFIQKPYHPKALMALVESTLARETAKDAEAP